MLPPRFVLLRRGVEPRRALRSPNHHGQTATHLAGSSGPSGAPSPSGAPEAVASVLRRRVDALSPGRDAGGRPGAAWPGGAGWRAPDPGVLHLHPAVCVGGPSGLPGREGGGGRGAGGWSGGLLSTARSWHPPPPGGGPAGLPPVRGILRPRPLTPPALLGGPYGAGPKGPTRPSREASLPWGCIRRWWTHPSPIILAAPARCPGGLRTGAPSRGRP